MTDQRVLWDRKHSLGDHEKYANQINNFAKSTLVRLHKGQQLLDLGCGIGKDDYYFAMHGLEVTATDFSEVVIADNRARYISSNLQFVVMDLSEPLPYGNASFDAVYAHLSLHYFNTAKTRAILQEITRVLKPQGQLFMACKSPRDVLYGRGQRVEEDTFVDDGHIRHFFSEPYTRDLLKDDYIISSLHEVRETYDDKVSAFIRCVASKK